MVSPWNGLALQYQGQHRLLHCLVVPRWSRHHHRRRGSLFRVGSNPRSSAPGWLDFRKIDFATVVDVAFEELSRLFGPHGTYHSNL